MDGICRSLLFQIRFTNKYLLERRPRLNYGRILSASHRTERFSTELDFDLFEAKGPPKYEKVLEAETPNIVPKSRPKDGDAIIECLRPHLNHYRNQKYQNFDAIPLASKGWKRNQSKGDHFTVNIYDHEGEFLTSESSFSDLRLHSEVITAVETTGITKPTKIQEDAIPVVLSGKNTLIAAETGCGKTLSYLLPVVQQSIEWGKLTSDRPPNSPVSLILCPSRELATQIGRVAKMLSHQLPFSCHTLIGGRTKKKMLNPEFRHSDVLIATLGALSKLSTTGIYNMRHVKHIVLDEADTMLDDSFSELLQRFLRRFRISDTNSSTPSAPNGVQLTLVSATMPRNIFEAIEDFIEPDSLVKVTSSRLHKVLGHVPQIFYRLGPSEKPTKLLQIAKNAAQRKIPTIIFSNKAPTCDWVSMMLSENGVEATSLNGAMPLVVRMGKLEEFMRGDVSVLSCTDIASRGLDTTHVKHVLNYDFPMYMADYIHRCGRTGRCGSPHECSVTNFVSGDREVELVQKIELSVRTMQELPHVTGNITRIIRNRVQRKAGK